MVLAAGRGLVRLAQLTDAVVGLAGQARDAQQLGAAEAVGVVVATVVLGRGLCAARQCAGGPRTGSSAGGISEPAQSVPLEEGLVDEDERLRARRARARLWADRGDSSDQDLARSPRAHVHSPGWGSLCRVLRDVPLSSGRDVVGGRYWARTSDPCGTRCARPFGVDPRLVAGGAAPGPFNCSAVSLPRLGATVLGFAGRALVFGPGCCWWALLGSNQ